MPSSYWTTIDYTCTTAPSASLIGQSVTITGLTGAYAYLANRTGTVVAVNGNVLSIAYYSTVSFSASGQSGTATVGGSTLYLTRSGNFVRAYLGSSLPANFLKGFWVSLTDSSGNIINGPTNAITGIKRDSNGIVTVNLTTAWTNLVPGTVVYLTPPNVNYSGTVSVVNNSATVTYASGSAFDNSFVGQTIILGGVGYVVESVSGTTLTLTLPYQSTTGSVSYGVAVSVFGTAGFQKVYEVLSATSFTYQSLDTEVVSSISGGTVYIQWSPLGGTYGNAAQITSTGTDSIGAWIQWFQLGPDDQLTLGSAPQVTVIGQASPGTHQFVVFYENEDGAQTAPSTIVNAEAAGNGNLFLLGSLPIGPAGTTKRVIAATAAGGDSFFYLMPTSTAAQTGLGPSIVTGTEVLDNISIAATIDFSDAALLQGVSIDTSGNDLFSQVRLDPCCGVYPYSTRLFWWGELNNRKNMRNLGFDAGYTVFSGVVSATNGSAIVNWENGAGHSFVTGPAWNGATIIIGGVPYTIQSVQLLGELTLTEPFAGTSAGYTYYVLSPAGTQPPYWDASHGDGNGTLAVGTRFGGFYYQMSTAGNCEIRQGVYQDEDGGTILEPNTTYIVRFLASLNGSDTVGSVKFTLHSDTLGTGSDSTASFALASLGSSDGWLTGTIMTPNVMEADHVIRLYLSGTSGTSVVNVDEIEFLPQSQPVLDRQVRASYSEDPFGYDGNSGYIAPIGVESPVSGLRQLREYLYILTEQALRQTTDVQTEPSNWPVRTFDTECGNCSPWSLTGSEDWLLWGGRHGIRFCDGNPQTKKINQEVARTWETIRWDDPMSMWLAADGVQRQTYIGIKTGSGGNVSDTTLVLNYRLADSTYNVPDPIHISMYSGKMLATDLGRKWAPWYRSIPCGATVSSNPYGLGVQKNMLFGGSQQRRAYYLDVLNYPPLNGGSTLLWNPTDDDWGGYTSEYVTSFFYPRELENQPMVGAYRKLFAAFGYHALGVGLLYVTPYIDALNSPAAMLPIYQPSYPDRSYDLDVGLNVVANRMALGFSAPAGSAFGITHLSVSGRLDMVFPMRGAL